MKAGDFLLIQFGTNDETHTCPRYASPRPGQLMANRGLLGRDGLLL